MFHPSALSVCAYDLLLASVVEPERSVVLPGFSSWYDIVRFLPKIPPISDSGRVVEDLNHGSANVIRIPGRSGDLPRRTLRCLRHGAGPQSEISSLTDKMPAAANIPHSGGVSDPRSAKYPARSRVSARAACHAVNSPCRPCRRRRA